MKYFLSALISCFSLFIVAQNLRFAPVNSQWSSSYFYRVTPSMGTIHMEYYWNTQIVKDTTINNLLYQKVRTHFTSYNEDGQLERSTYRNSLLFYNNKKLFRGYHSDSMNLIIDYNLGVGDTFNYLIAHGTPYPLKLTVTKEDTALAFGKQRRFLELKNENGRLTMIWMEGVGDSLRGFSDVRGMLPPVGQEKLTCFRPGPLSSDFCFNSISQAETYLPKFSLYPNPSDGRLHCEVNEDNTPLYIYNTSGELVSKFTLSRGKNKMDLSFLPAGLYMVVGEENASLLIQLF